MMPFPVLVLLLLGSACLAVGHVTSKPSQIQHAHPSETVSSIHKTLTSRHANQNFISSAQSVIDRVLLRGGISYKFSPVLELIDYETRDGQQYDVFEIDGKDGNVVLRGSNAVALTTAFGHYLRYYTNCDVHWEDGGDYSMAAFPSSLNLLPIPKKTERVVFLAKWRYYQNTCTASYSFAWKNWTQWEADIDWMALNGFNLPLAFTGQELVWQLLWKQYGVSDEGLQQYFSGPAFLAWQRMANIRAYGGPLSSAWINQQADLQRNILQRYFELGMVPVMPAFNGVVPAEMQKLFPTANITRLDTWNNFPEEYSCNYILSSTDPLFVQIGKAFLEMQFSVWGEDLSKSHIYNCDTFNENKPASGDYDYLSGSSSAVYNSMTAADPDAIWLMQGWLFINDRTFWTDEHIASYLSGVPDHGMVILDLSSEDLPVWDKISANKKQFIWCMLHNYGGRRALYGNLTLLATDPINVAATAGGYFLGTGLTMEAIDQNPVVYEFMSEMAWQRESPSVPRWISHYVDRRYGLNTRGVSVEAKAAAQLAWQVLTANNYHGDTPVCHHPCSRESIVQKQPSWSMYQDRTTGATALVDVWSSLLLAGTSLLQVGGNVKAFTYDLVDVNRQVLTNLFWDYYTVTQHFFNTNDALGLEYMIPEVLALVRDLDSLLATHESYLFGRWISAARSWAISDEEAALYDFNARNQVTLWGDNGEINDYSAKNWAGLVGKYYLKRWEMFLSQSLKAVKANTVFDQSAYNAQALSFGQSFCHDNTSSFPTATDGNTLNVSLTLQDKYGNTYHSSHGYILRKDTDTASSSANLLPTPLYTRNIRQLQKLCDITLYCVGFTTEGLMKTDESNLITRTGVDFFVKGKCKVDEPSGKITC